MKLAWFTPFGQDSAIGKYSSIVTKEIAKQHQVDIWVPDKGSVLSTSLEVRRFTPDLALDQLTQYDYCIYNIGNHLGFHKDIYEISKRRPGIVILHDFVMHHFFAGYYSGGDREKYLSEMKFYYGAEGYKLAYESIKGIRKPIWETNAVVDFPFFEKTLEHALGVAVHARFLAEKVQSFFIGPIGLVHFPDPSTGDGKPYEFKNLPKLIDTDSEKLVMMTLGHLNPNKCIEKVIAALGQNKDLARKILYIVVGPTTFPAYLTELKTMIVKMHLQDSVRLLGFQNTDVVRNYMKQSDIFINLRSPTIEGASWSLIEQLYFGKPTIVMNTGFYSEFPDDCVIKIDVGQEATQLDRALFELVSDKGFRERMGGRALAFVKENFNVEKYASAFNALLENVRQSEARLGFVDRVGKEMADMQISQETGLFQSVAETINNFLGVH